MKNSLIAAFDIKNEVGYNNLTDYEMFKDKDLLDQLRTRIIESLIDENITKDKISNEIINSKINVLTEGIDLSNLERSYLFDLINEEVNGYGPLTHLLDNNEISEIMVNRPDEVYIEVNGNLIKDENTSFINDEHILRTIKMLIEPIGRTIDASNPMIDSRLKDGSRINAVIPPLSVAGPVLTIRKFKDGMNSIEELIRLGTLTPEMARFLSSAVMAKLNIIVSGSSGSGKTSLLNILGSFIPNNERIITIEDAAELNLEKEHVISLETRNSNYNEEKDVTIRDLVINSLRMRPDRIIVGEVRGIEAFDMLQAMNTGHDGGMTTLHANSPVDALNRLESMVLMNGMELPVKAIREYINNAIDLIVNIDRMSDGKRKITSITEIQNIVDDRIVLKEIFAFNQTGLTATGEVIGEFIQYNFIPKCYEKIKARGIKDVDDIFNYRFQINALPKLNDK